MNRTSCVNDIESLATFMNSLESPALLLQAVPRQVVTANNKACALFDKRLDQIEGYRGGQVFDCVHAFTEAGCGLDSHCENCKIKNAIVDTFATGNPHTNVRTILDIKKHTKITPHELQVSTEKIGDFALVTIEKYMTQA
jgi:hypothetical protein